MPHNEKSGVNTPHDHNRGSALIHKPLLSCIHFYAHSPRYNLQYMREEKAKLEPNELALS